MIPLVAALLPVIGKVIDKVIPSTEARDKAKAEITLQLAQQENELLKLFAEIDKGQLEINKVEAASSSLFVAGWRPFIGWVSASGLTWAFVVKPVLEWAVSLAHGLGWITMQITFPTVETAPLIGLVTTMLGMGTLRMVEKLKGVDRSNLVEL